MNNQGESSVKISLQVSLDRIDIDIINAMATSRFLKIHEIRTIMEYNGISIGYGVLKC